MFSSLPTSPADPILSLMAQYRADPREQKIDLGVGVFKNAAGETPIMKAVHEAEAQLLADQQTKSYVGMAGAEAFNQQMISLVTGDTLDDRITGIQAPGGSGALRVLADLLYRLDPELTVWVSDPTWGNHNPLIGSSGLQTRTYPYLDRQSRMVDEARMLEHINTLGQRDVLLLHACCHNPTGAEISPAGWDQIAEICARRGILPFVDCAYLGFGDGIEPDGYGVRTLAAVVPEMVIAASCSKNFGLYRERVGCAMIVGKRREDSEMARKHALLGVRTMYSMPPDHGAAVVASILADEQLRQLWITELDQTRERMLTLRQQLADALARECGDSRWQFVADHRGMFSLLGLNDDQQQRLIEAFAIYVVRGGRINIAGLANEEEVNRFAAALAEVTR